MGHKMADRPGEAPGLIGSMDTTWFSTPIRFWPQSYKQLYLTLRDAERSLQDRVDSLSSHLEAQTIRADILQQQLEQAHAVGVQQSQAEHDLQEQLAACCAGQQQLQGQLAQCVGDKQVLQEQLTSVLSESTTWQQAAHTAQDQVTALQAQLRACQQEQLQAQAELSASQVDAQAAKASLAAAQELLASAQTELLACQQDQEQLHADLVTSQGVALGVTALLASAHEQVSALQAHAANCQLENISKQMELEAATSLAAQFMTQMQQDTEVYSLAAQYQNNAIQALSAQVGEALTDLQACQERHERSQALSASLMSHHFQVVDDLKQQLAAFQLNQVPLAPGPAEQAAVPVLADIFPSNVPVVEPHQLQDVVDLAEGTFGKVIAARVTQFGKVAVKMLKAGGKGTDLDAAVLFLMEQQLMSRLQHPNIVRLVAIVMNPTCPHSLPNNWVHGGLVMEHVGGGTLEQWGSQSPSLLDKTQAALGVSKAMAYLHSRKPAVLHLDLKSENVLIVKDEHGAFLSAKVTDFGYAMEVEGETIQLPYTRGTPAFSSPEMWLKCIASKRSDVWSMGILLWQLYTEKQPCLGVCTPEQLSAVLSAGLLPVNLALVADSAWRAIIASCLDFNPENRPSFDDLVASLEWLYQQRQALAAGAAP